MVALVAAGGLQAAPVVSQWVAGNGNWNTAANWNPATVPNNGANQFTAVIFTGSGAAVSLDTAATVNGLFVLGNNDRLSINPGRSMSVVGVGSGNDGFSNSGIVGVTAPGTGTLTIGSGVTTANVGFLRASGGGTLRLNGDLNNANGAGTILAQNGSVVEFGDGSVRTGVLTTQGSGLLRTAAGSTMQLFNVFVGGPLQLSNASRLTISGFDTTNASTLGVSTPGSARLEVTSGSGFHNAGTLRASGGGVLDIDAAITNTGGTIEALDGSVVQLQGAFFQGRFATGGTGVIRALRNDARPVELSSVTNVGTFELSPSSVVRASNVTNTGVMGVLSTGSARLDILGSSGLRNSGTLRASGGGQLFIEDGAVVVNTGGTIEAMDGSLVVLTPGEFFGGTLATSGSGVIRASPFLSNPVGLRSLTNTGTFEATSGSDVAVSNVTNSGVMGKSASGSASLRVDDGSTLTNTGVLGATGAGTVLDVNNRAGSRGLIDNTGGVIEALGGAVLTVFNGFVRNTEGLIRVDGPSRMTLQDSAVLLNFDPQTQTLTGGTYDLAGPLQVSNADIVHNAAVLTLRGPEILDKFNRGGRIVDRDDRDALVALSDNTGSLSLIRKAFGTTAAFTNGGTLAIDAGSLFTSTGGRYTQTLGTTTVDGTLAAADIRIEGGRLQGGGTVQGDVTNAGIVAPGHALGLLTIDGDYLQEAAGHLAIQIEGLLFGTQHDALDVHGTATLGGLLDIALGPGFDLDVDGYFDILVADDILGRFDDASLPSSSRGGFSVAYLLDPSGVDRVRLIFDVDAGPPPTQVPEPGPLSLAFIGGMAAWLLRRSRV